ncbi:FecCD family ABC transporter permease [Enterovirga aerilata]|uniref:Iron ABC transporter permease n=1 Tax=Enterovirga aerilata TaxID=2730920 RepID=A0A849HZB0_9HYPH|nr:iron ABC transporter permease [Enterovirga sp. DB1703]NNM72876.1 iron ABC transporter permease [Enterovirga sp. DB1703]
MSAAARAVRTGLASRGADASPRPAPAAVLALLAALVAGVAVLSLGTGAVAIPPGRVVDVLRAGRAGASADPGLLRDVAIVLDIRMPRTLVGLAVGALLAVSGALLQGLFRNPLADPALIGVSSGSTVAVAGVIVLGHRFATGPLPFEVLPVAAFLGALAATALLYAIATRRGRTSIATMLLAGVALAALSMAGTGFLAFLSDDRQLRDLSFWTLGAVGGATWTKLAAILPMLALTFAAAPFLARALNALVLGEAEAFHLGIAVQRVKALAVLTIAVAVGAAVATAGPVGFVGLVVPHAVRIVAGPDHRVLLPASALLGAALLVAADMVARVAVAPAELPIGIVTALIGAPYFLWLLLRRSTVLDA